MKILVDIGHPAHVHFFAIPIRLWQEAGCQVFVTSRRKEIATDLLDALCVPHQVISSMNTGSMGGMLKELIQRDQKLLQIVRKERPNIMVGIGGVFIAHTGFITRTPSLVFYDTENATLSNLITYPFASLVVVPSCYQAWLPPWNLKYPGFHELSYLHPNHFQPDREIALACGLAPEGPTFLIRTVSWQASHDLTEKGWNSGLLRKVVSSLASHGKVIISAEGELPEDLCKYRYHGQLEQIHHLMGHISLFIGESATMASECAILGVPAIYAAHSGRGYTDEQEKKYGLVFNLRQFDWPVLEQTIAEIFAVPWEKWREKRETLLREKIEVAGFITELILNYPKSRNIFKKQFAKVNIRLDAGK